MNRWLVAVALLAACRNASPSRKDAGSDRPASAVSGSIIPKLPRTEDGVAELRALDQRIEIHRNELAMSTALRLERAGIRGDLEDYQQGLADSAVLVEKSPTDAHAWDLRVDALLRVHEFAAAREALQKLAPLTDRSKLAHHEIVLAEAAGDADRVLAMRGDAATSFPSAQNMTLWAGALAQAGRTNDAIAMIPRAAAAIRDNPPALIAWLVFQWGRCYELAGELATARKYYEVAHARLPGYLEATTHLAQTMIATGDRDGARKLVDDALADNRHPELLALAAELGHPELAEQARTEWERYVAALPLAFSDHAARFYLGVGHNAPRALELARTNFNNRNTRDARALVIEAALATGDTAAACAVVDPLISAGTRAQRFTAWQALSRCGRAADAEQLGRALGIAP